MADAVRAAARAKINLNLQVVGRRDDGYHEIDSLVTFATIGDVVTARPDPDGPPLGIALEGPFAATLMDAAPSAGDNLVIRAAAGLRTLAERQGIVCEPVHLTLEKNLPVAAGLGGGSADAAATIGALSRLWSLPRDLPDTGHLLRLLGADVAMCLAGRPLRATGIGDRLERVDMPVLDLVLVNPGVAVPTAAVFARDEVLRSGPQRDLDGDLVEHLATTRNDLEPAARAVAPEVGAVLDALAETTDCRLARMSGSGATCFGIFPDEAAARAAAQTIRTAFPDWWCQPVRTVAS